MENVISEFRVIETEDGFRIEIKGDKEKLRSFFSGMGGPGAWRWGHHRGRGGPWGASGFPPGFMGWAAPWWGDWGFTPEKEDKGDQPKEA